MFSYQFWEIYKNTLFYRTLLVAASGTLTCYNKKTSIGPFPGNVFWILGMILKNTCVPIFLNIEFMAWIKYSKA